MVACGVAIFILYGMKNADFTQFEKQPFQINLTLKEKIEFDYQRFKPKFSFAIALGVVLCILAPMIYMLVENNLVNDLLARFSRKNTFYLVESYATGSMFLTIASGVFLLIFSSIHKYAYDLILQNEKKQAQRCQEEQENNLYGIIMSFAGILYLILGFCFGWWHPGWLIFPIAALIAQALQITKKGKN